MVDESGLVINRIAKDIAGEIVLSDSPEKVMKKWREIFNFSQKKIAGYLGITSSVISDYESGRRKSPGIHVVKRYVNALLNMDLKRGGNVIKNFTHTFGMPAISHAVLDIKEFIKGMDVGEFCKVINAVLVNKNNIERQIYGYTVIDSVKAISELSFNQLVGLYGATTQRALIFTGVTTGRTPMVAIKLTGLQPGLVVLHGVDEVDEVAKNIGEVENIPLAICKLENVEDIVEKLKLIQ